MKRILNYILTFIVISNVSAQIQEQLVRAAPANLPALPGRLVPRANFVNDILAGSLYATEQALQSYLESEPQAEFLAGYGAYEQANIIEEVNGNLILKKQSSLWPWNTPREYQCGRFQLFSIQELQNLIDGPIRLRELPGGGTFNVVEGFGTGGQSWFRRFVDVGALQADPHNANAVFQVASNFNGLETTHAWQNIEQQTLASYINDRTQGPSASISAAPGLIARRFFAFYDQAQPCNTWLQTRNHSINFLSNLAHVVPVSPAAYVTFNEEPVAPGPDDYRSIKVGFHADVQVTHGFMVDRDNHLFIGDEGDPQIINQVFTAAVDLWMTNRPLMENAFVLQWAQQILNAAYEGTLKAAFVAGKRRVFLTLVGGGVFGNSFGSIFAAINRMQQFIIDSGMEVILVRYNGDNQATSVQLRNNLIGLVTATGGHYTQYRNDGEYSLTLQG